MENNANTPTTKVVPDFRTTWAQGPISAETAKALQEQFPTIGLTIPKKTTAANASRDPQPPVQVPVKTVTIPTESTENTPAQPESKGWFAGLRQTWSKLLTVKHEHTVDPNTRGTLERGVAALRTIPDSIGEAALSPIKAVSSKLGLPESVSPQVAQFVCMLTDVITLALCDDVKLIVLNQPRLLFQYGLLNTAIIDGIVLLAKEFTKRYYAPIDQGEEEEEESKTTFIAGAKALLAGIYQMTVGTALEYIPSDIIKALIAANVVFLSAKNAQYFGTYLIRLLKWVVNAVYKLFTGKYFLDAEANALYDHMRELSLQALEILDAKPDRYQASNARLLEKSMAVALAKATALEMDKDILEQFSKLCTRLSATLVDYIVEANMGDPRPIPVMYMLVGATGVGKSTINTYIQTMLKKACSWPGTLEQNVNVFSKGVNFQAPAHPYMRLMAFDDMFLVSDNEKYSEVLDQLTTLGSGSPTLQDAAGIPDKGKIWLGPEFVQLAENMVPEIPVTTPEAAARRFVGGIHTLRVTEEWKTQNGMLDNEALTQYLAGEHTWTEKMDMIDRVWILTDHAGVQRTVSEFVAMLVYLRNSSKRGVSLRSAFIAEIGANFVTPGRAKITGPPMHFPKDIGKLPSLNYDRKEVSIDPSTPVRVEIHDPVRDGNIIYPSGPERSPAQTSLVLDEDQSFECADLSQFASWFDDGTASAETNKKNRGMALNFMKFSPDTYKMDKNTLTCNGVLVDRTAFRAKFAPVHEPQPVNIHVGPDRWTPDTIRAFEGKKFWMHGTCVRHDNFCYHHGDKVICESYDDDAVEVGPEALSHWALIHVPANVLSTRAYHQLVVSAKSPMESSPRLCLLKTFLMAIGSATVAWSIGVLLNNIWQQFQPKASDQAYSSKSALRVKPKGDQKLPSLRIGKAKVVDQSVDDWRTTKFQDSIIPCITTGGGNMMRAFAARIQGNFWVTTKHQTRGFNRIHFGGNVNMSMDLRKVDSPEELQRDVNYAQYLTVQGVDVAFLIVPKDIPPVKSVFKYLVSRDVDPKVLTGLFMLNSTQGLELDAEGKIVPQLPVPVTKFPLGDCIAVASYTTSAPALGLAVRAAVPTKQGDCSKLVMTSNVHVGRGYAQVCGIVAAGSSDGTITYVAPLNQDDLRDFMAACPPGVLTMATAQSEPVAVLPPNNTANFSDLRSYGQLPKGMTQYANTTNKIIPTPFPVANALIGMEYVDPITKQRCVVETPQVEPARLHEIKPSLAKLRMTPSEIAPSDYALWTECVNETWDRVWEEAHPRTTKTLERLWSIDEALNGVPTLGIPGIDLRKSPGFCPFLPHNGQGRSAYVELKDGLIVPKQPFFALVEKYTNMMLKGKHPISYVVANLKMELRPIGKPARVTHAMSFALFVTIRRFVMHIPAMIISGQGRNGFSFGADLNGVAGRMYVDLNQFMEYITSSDAKTFDASQTPSFCGPEERAAARILMRTMPFLNEDSAVIPFALGRVRRQVSGVDLYHFMMGYISGHIMTTGSNCVKMQAVALYAFKKENKDPSLTFKDAYACIGYGDDLTLGSHQGLISNTVLSTRAAELRITLQPLTKPMGDTEVVVEYEDPLDFSHLKRRPLQAANGYAHFLLDMSVIAHIPMWYHKNDMDWRRAVSVNVEAALRELFHYGPLVFTQAYERLSRGCKEAGVPVPEVSFATLYRNWFNNQGGSKLEPEFGVDKPSDIVFQYAFAGSRVEHHDHVVDQSLANSVKTYVAPDLSVDSVVKSNPASMTSKDPSSGVLTQRQLTTNVDESVLTKTVPLKGDFATAPGIAPYPNTIGAEVSNEYDIATVTWPTNATQGTVLYSFDLPEIFFGFPKVSSSLSRYRNLFSNVELKLKVNGNPFVGGAVKVSFMPFLPTSGLTTGRYDPIYHLQCPGIFLSAGRSEAHTLKLPYSADTNMYSLESLTPAAAIGSIWITVFSPLTWTSTTPPTALNIKITGRLVDVVVDGNIASPGPAVLYKQLAQRARKAKDGIQWKHPSAWSNVVYFGEAIDQSEQVQKSSEGLLEGVASATKTVEAIMGTASEVIGLLDKPVSVQAPHPTFNSDVGTVGFSNTRGMDLATFVGASQSPMLSVEKPLFGFTHGQPRWNEVLQIPGLIDQFAWPTASAAGAQIYQRPINPTTMFSTSPAPPDGMYYPGPLAYYAMVHTYWRGPLKVMIQIFGPVTQKGSLRIIWNASQAAVVGVPTNAIGDVLSAQVDVVGDTEFAFELPYSAKHASMVVLNPASGANELTQFGVLEIQVATPLASQNAGSAAPLKGFIWLAAGKGFELIRPRNMFPGWTSAAIGEAEKGSFKVKTNYVPTMRDDHAKDQSVIAKFGEPFPTLAPAKPVFHSFQTDSDYTSGPCELAKRPTFAYVSSLPDSFSPTIIANTLAFYCVAPFTGYSGAVSTTYVFPAEVPTMASVITDSQPDSEITTTTWGGFTLHNSRIVKLGVGYDSPHYFVETIGYHGDPKYPTWVGIDDFPTGAATPCHAFQNFCDDLVLYRYVACPALLYTTPPVVAKGKPKA